MPYKDPEKQHANDIKRKAAWRERNRDRAVEATRAWQQSERGKQKRAEYHARKRAEILADSMHPSHGTIAGYGFGCRCERCAMARRDYVAGR